MGDLEIQETNKIRVALGMKPLPVPSKESDGTNGPIFKNRSSRTKRSSSSGSSASNNTDSGSGSDTDDNATYEARQSKAASNWQKLEDERRAAAKKQATKDAIRKARDAAQRVAKLEGKGLGDEGEDTGLDTKTWLKQQSKRQKKIEEARKKKMAEELEERERMEQQEYTAADLAGIKVGHEIDRFDEGGGEQVLVLKDTNVVDDEDEDDELENVELRDREEVEARLKAKRKRPVYDPSEEAEGAGVGGGSLLGQYDEEIHGKQRSRFTLDGQGKTVEQSLSGSTGATEGKKRIGNSITLDLLQDEMPASDYVDPSEIKVRKPKKKKAKTSRVRREDDDGLFPVDVTTETNGVAESEQMTVDSGSTAANAKKKIKDDANFVDDDDLQANLALQRRQALKKREKIRPEQLLKQMREEEDASVAIQADGEADAEPGLVIDETSEFVDRLQRTSAFTRREAEIKEEEEEDENMDIDRRGIYKEDDDQDAEMQSPAADNINANQVKQEIKQENTEEELDLEAIGFSEEAAVNKGVGPALALLTQRGLIDKAEKEDLNKGFRERQHFLAEKHKREDEAERKARYQREKDRQSGRFEHMSARDREEYARRINVQREQGESRDLAELFNREYKPNFRLSYSDEFGREVDRVEAFKNLSHQFHGKGSGKQKTEKRLKKIKDEKRKMAESSLDSSQRLGMNNVAGVTARKNRQAGVRLQ